MKIGTIVAVSASAAVLAACASEGDPATEPESEVEADIGTDGENESDNALMLDLAADSEGTLIPSTGSAVAYDPECVITETGIAGIDSPATLGNFVEAFPAGTALHFEPVYMVDFGALCALSEGENAICAIFESYDVESYDADIEVIALGAYADQCRTGEGVGPGSSIADVVDVYGGPRFGFSWENEGREYVSFAEAPQAFSFRAESDIGAAEGGGDTVPPGPHGGDYTGVVGDSYFETETAHPDARIWEIWVTPIL